MNYTIEIADICDINSNLQIVKIGKMILHLLIIFIKL